MDIKNLITFIHVAELNSFTKAAEKLGYSQSTVSFQIKQLEAELDTLLFERINHTVALTEMGRAVLKYAHQINELTQTLKENMQKEKVVSGHVRLAMADSLCDSLLGEGFLEFRKKYPGITLKITAAVTEEMFRLIDHNEADVILTLDNHIYNTEYVIVREEKIGMHFVAGAASPLAHLDSISVKELVNQPFILTEKGMSYRRLMDEKLAGMSLEIQPVLEIGSAGLICSLVEQGAGISFLPDYVTEEGMKSGKLAYLNVSDFKIEIWKQLLYHRDKWVSPQMESVIQYCVSREFGSPLEDRL
ncbi:MAG: LysR family transcriptional regulator [Lachnospiraceae bacterium]|nr:LysR family transcriptional regulator [Lachnospiraceae bacterium]